MAIALKKQKTVIRLVRKSNLINEDEKKLLITNLEFDECATTYKNSKSYQIDISGIILFGFDWRKNNNEYFWRDLYYRVTQEEKQLEKLV